MRSRHVVPGRATNPAPRRPRPARAGPVVATAVFLLLLTPGAADARETRTLFHGMPVEAESGMGPSPAKNPVSLSRAWMFDEFRARLAGPPATDDHMVVASDRAGNVVALAGADGQVLWTTRLAQDLETGPALAGGLVLQGTSSGDLVAMDAASGHVVWRVALGGPPLAPATDAAGHLLVITSSPALVAVDPSGGEVRTVLALPGTPVAPALGPGVVMIGTDHGMLLAVDPSTLEVRWRRYLRYPVTAPALVSGKRVYVAVGDRSLHCLRLKSGRNIWRQRLGSIATARLVQVDDYVDVLSWDNDIYVVKRRNGHMATRVRLDHRLSLDAALGPQHLFVAPFTEGSVVALSLPGLGMAGRFNLDMPGEWFTTAPVLVGGRVAVGAGRDTGRILALEVAPAAPPAAPGKTAPPAAAPAAAPATTAPATGR